MKERDPRKMALQIAGMRMNETLLPEDERIFTDPYAEFFFPKAVREMARNDQWAKTEREKYEAVMPGVNGALAARVRYMDECLIEAIRSGFTQLVMIGAGYDTRAYRIPGLKENIRVFEVDHPLTQKVKIRTISEIFGDLPDHVTYLPVVFGKDSIEQRLFESGYDSGLKTLFIVEGFLMYVPPAAVDRLLGFICKASEPGSAFIADYFDATVVDGTSPLKEAQALKSFVESEGSPLQFGIPDESIEAFFSERGFRQVSCFAASDCKEKYFKGEGLHRAVTPMFKFVRAVV